MFLEHEVAVMSTIHGSLSPQHCLSSGCRRRRKPPDIVARANILSKQSRAAEEGWSSNLQIGQGAYNSSPQERDMRLGIWKVKSLYTPGSLKTVATE